MAKTKPESTPDMYTETAETEAPTAQANGSAADTGGWEDGQTQTATACKRHRWNGGTVCVRCGAVKVETSTRDTSEDRPRTRGRRTGSLETLASMLWAGMGLAVERQPWQKLGAPTVLLEPVTRSDGSLSAPPAVAVGRVLQLEASVAGTRIDRAVRRTPAGRLVAVWLDKQGVGIFADLAPLLAPPLIVGLMALQPDRADDFKPFLVPLILPIAMEMAKKAEEQANLMQQMDGLTAETLENANQMVDSFLNYEAEAEV